MIFNKLFKRAHKHDDPKKRIEAIAQLSPGKEDDKRVLHELGFNDESASVNLAALQKLDSFTLWLKAYENHYQDIVQKKAKQQVLEDLESSSKVDDSLFVDIVQRQRHKPLVKEMLFSSKRLLGNTYIVADAVLKLCGENDIRRFYTSRAVDAHKSLLIDAINDEKQLRRLLKAEQSDALRAALSDKLIKLEEAAKLPAKIKASATLVNSRLLALTELNDYEQIESQMRMLIQEFDALKTQLHLLGEEQSAQVTSKYFAIKEKLEKRLASLEQDYLARKHLSGISDSISDIQGRAQSIFSQLEILQESSSKEQLEGQTDLLSSALQDLGIELGEIDLELSTAAHREMIASLSKRFDEARLLLANLPAQISRNAALDERLAQLLAMFDSQNPVKVDSLAHQTVPTGFTDTDNAAQALIKEGVSAKRKKAYLAKAKEFKSQLKAQLSEQESQRKRLEKRCFAKLSACASMVEQGKFKAAIATFNAANGIFTDLDKASASLNRKFEDTKGKVEELKDWQSYIAAPRKPELIEKAQALDPKNKQNQALDIAQRASLIKQYRKAFNALGKLNTPEDDALNQAFDDALESAFEPCREHYAKLDEIRAKNLSKGEQVLAALEALNAIEDPVLLAKQLQSVSKQYYNIGDLERKARTSLHKRYKASYAPLQSRVNAFYEQNALAKEKLVKKAEALIDTNTDEANIEEAVESAKKLQRDWKTIGFAGKQADSELWQAFRKANDAVFARLKANEESEKVALKTMLASLDEQLTIIASRIEQAQAPQDLGDLEAIFEQAQTQIDALRVDKVEQHSKQSKQTGQHYRAYDAKLSDMKKAHRNKLKRFEAGKAHDMLVALFNRLARVETQSTEAHSTHDANAKMPQAYAQCLDKPEQVEINETLKDLSLEQITMAADILLNESKVFADAYSTDKASKQAVKDVQLKLMAAKLGGQSVPDEHELLQAWIVKDGASEGADKDSQASREIYLAKLRAIYLGEV